MFTSYTEINNYPFTESSTNILNDSGYTFPLDLLMDACVYPRCENNAPFHVSSINKWSWEVSGKSGEVAFYIEFEDISPDRDYYVGKCYDQVGFCGTVLGSGDLYRWIRAVPGFSELPDNSLVFVASAVKPLGLSNRRANVLEDDNDPILSVTWGDHITVLPDHSATIKKENPLMKEAQDTPIRALIVNSAKNSEKQLSITPTVGSKVRVLVDSDIKIGKVTDL